MKIVKIIDGIDDLEELCLIRERMENEFTSPSEINLYFRVIELIDKEIKTIINNLKNEIKINEE